MIMFTYAPCTILMEWAYRMKQRYARESVTLFQHSFGVW